MNAVELDHLMRRDVSHLARSLYTFCIRPRLERGNKNIDLNELCSYLENKSVFFPTSGDPRLALMALLELERSGFIVRSDPNASFENCTLSFPFFDEPLKELPERPFKMRTDWKPGPSFAQSCLICGLEDYDYSSKELCAFRAYWNARPEERSQTAWERAFAQRLVRSRQARSAKQKNKASTSAISSAPVAQKIENPFQAQKM